MTRTREHRNKLETLYGKDALKDKVIHHINGVPSDNRIENLRIMTPSEHVALHCNIKSSSERCESGINRLLLVFSQEDFDAMKERKGEMTWEEFVFKAAMKMSKEETP